MNNQEIANLIYESLCDLNPNYLNSFKLCLTENKGQYDSITIIPSYSPYRENTKSTLFCRVKNTGKSHYIAFNSQYSALFDKFGVRYSSAKSEVSYIRIDLDDFKKYINNADFADILNRIFLDSFCLKKFDCCSKYNECSDARHCVHEDAIYSTACTYRKHSENGKIFYGENRNMDKNGCFTPPVITYQNVKVDSVFKETQSANRPEKGENLIAFPDDYVIIDLETTGLSPEYDEIIEVAALKVKNGLISDSFQSLVKPRNEVGDYISELTGITNDMLSSAPSIEEVLPKYLSFIGDAVVVGHNVNFDVNFIYDNDIRCFNEPFRNNFIDTMRLARKLYPELKHHRLKDLVTYLNIPCSSLHRALGDCDITLECFNKMRSLAIEKYSSLEEFKKNFKRHKAAVNLKTIVAESSDIDENNPFYGKYCVFTGELQKMKRVEAAQIVVNLGGFCGNAVTKKTNFLILGNNDYCSAIKDGKSNKQKKAEEYKLKGLDIEIIPESVFYDMIEY